jgi:hypothetical protein
MGEPDDSARCAKEVEADRQAIRVYLNRWARIRGQNGDRAGAALLTTAGCMIVLGSHTDQDVQAALSEMEGERKPRLIFSPELPHCMEVHLSDEEMVALLDLCAKTGRNQADLLRQALATLVR